ncbi:MAG: histidine phosphatase family protein [Spirochaetales bacterium]|nr:MAG: histidine phosphatase family protein [Spirochaetales bacterium]
MSYPLFNTLPDKTWFYFVRHGESESNRAGRVQGHSNSSLTDDGIRHAEAAGKWFSDKGIDAFYTSPLDRTRETACIIGDQLRGLELKILDDLIELDTGALSGRRVRDLEFEDPELHRMFSVHSWEVIPGAESIPSLYARALRIWESLILRAQAGARKILCVTHGGTLQWILKSTIAGERHAWMPVFPAHNCGIFLFTAESTSLEHDAPVDPETGFYGSWDLINHLPYPRTDSLPDPVSRG